jgi:hypothetical protein
MKQYKVLTQKDKWFSGKFDPAQLEAALNSYAQQGFEVKAATTASMPGLLGSSTRDEMVIILERDDTRLADAAAHRAKVEEVAQKSFAAPNRPAVQRPATDSEPPTYQL